MELETITDESGQLLELNFELSPKTVVSSRKSYDLLTLFKDVAIFGMVLYVIGRVIVWLFTQSLSFDLVTSIFKVKNDVYNSKAEKEG